MRERHAPGQNIDSMNSLHLSLSCARE